MAARRSNPNLLMAMVGNLIDAMLTHSAQAARYRHRPQRASRCPSSAFAIVDPAATPINHTASSDPVFDPPRHENHSESAGHSGQRNPVPDRSYYYLIVTAIFLPAMLHHDSRTRAGVHLALQAIQRLGLRQLAAAGAKRDAGLLALSCSGAGCRSARPGYFRKYVRAVIPRHRGRPNGRPRTGSGGESGMPGPVGSTASGIRGRPVKPDDDVGD